MPKIKFHNIPEPLQRRVRVHIAAKEHLFFAVVQPGLENTALFELRNAGIGKAHTHERGGVLFSGKVSECYRANMESRTITRVLLRISSFRARRFSKLRDLAGKIPWELFIVPQLPLSFSVTAHTSRLYHTGRIALECFRAISTRFAELGMNCPEWVENSTDEHMLQTVFIRIVDDVCTISIDSTGMPLYKRGYKMNISEAPLRETTAAAILLEAGIGDVSFFIDPMAGSGSFSLEAGMIACNIPPGLNRRFAFEHWPAYSILTRERLEKNLRLKILSPHQTTFRMLISDIDARTLDAARANIESAGLAPCASFRCMDFFSTDASIPADTSALIALNPPYGKRLMDPTRALHLYEKIGAKLRSLSPVRYAVIAPGEEFERALGLRAEKRIHFTHGGISVIALIGRI